MKTIIALAISVVAAAAASPLADGDGQWYLLAASPTIYGTATYAASLYTIGENKELKLARMVAPTKDGVDFVLSSPSALVVGRPNLGPRTFDIVHVNAPGTVDSVTPDIKGREVIDGFIAEREGQSILVLRVESPTERAQGRWSLIGIDLTKSTSERIIDPLPMSYFAGERWDGETGGPLLGRSPHLAATATKGGWTTYGTVVFPKSPGTHSIPDGLTYSIRCINDRFVVLDPGGRSHADALMQMTSTALVCDRRTGTSRTITVPGGQSRLRLFGPWLAVVVVESATAHEEPMPGSDLHRKRATATRPGIAEAYENNRKHMGEWLPGTLELINLETGTVIQQNTKQADSEVLTISGNQVVYRINQQIFEASILDGALQNSVLLTEGEDVPEVHWVFWSTN